jgi:hypothetical protein
MASKAAASSRPERRAAPAAMNVTIVIDPTTVTFGGICYRIEIDQFPAKTLRFQANYSGNISV